MGTYTTWEQAYSDARDDARRYQRPMAIEKANEYGQVVYRVKMIPIDPSKRFGWETKVEVVEP